MADVKKIATRESYGNALKALGGEVTDLVVLDADLAGATKTNTFQKAYPDRFFDCGIAEANMIGAAAGLSTMGLVPFASTFAMFAAGRAYEQIRNTIGYPHLNVKIGATHGGISVGEDGASHQCCEDFGLMRTIPGMTVMCPADDVEATAMVRAAYEHVGPVYMRFARLATPVFHDPDHYTFQIGKGEVLREGTDVAIIATGLMVYEALEAAKALEADGISARVTNMATIKPLDEALVLQRPRRRQDRHRRGAQHHRRPGRSGLRLRGRALPRPRQAHRRPGHLWPLRPRCGSAEAVRPVRGQHCVCARTFVGK